MTDCSALWPKSERLEDVIPHWGMLLGRLLAGGAVLDGAKLIRPCLLVIRGAKHGDHETHELIHRATYDDAFCFFDPIGTPPVTFNGAAHAYQKDSTLSVDVNGDGRPDVASVKPGSFVLTLALTKPHPVFFMTMPDGSGRIPANRDVNHDLRIDQGEGESFATAVLLHTGWDAPPGAEHRSSIACWTCPLPQLDHMAHVCGAAGGKMDALLVTTAQALAALPRLDNPGGLVA